MQPVRQWRSDALPIFMNIYCDEAGFTGNKLLDAAQDIFAYTAVAIEPLAAEDLVKRVVRDCRLQGLELKGRNLLKHEQGRRAINSILTACNDQFRVVAHLKPYALTSKLFEYIFEPAVSNFNSILYDLRFNRFIATLLFIYFRAQSRPAETLLEDFVKFAHDGDVSALEAIFPPAKEVSYKDNVLHAIGLFAQLHKNEIAEEVLRHREPGVPNWILDLTTTSLFNLLAYWGERYDELEVTCDQSKPLKGDKPVFDCMIGRKDKVYFTFSGEEYPYSFNLKSEIRLVDSKEVPGIQIADVISAITAKLYSNKYRSVEDPLLERFVPLIQGHMLTSIWPDFADADLGHPECFANTLILHELIDQSLAGGDLSKNLRAIAYHAHRVHPRFLKENPSLRPEKPSRKRHKLMDRAKKSK